MLVLLGWLGAILGGFYALLLAVEFVVMWAHGLYWASRWRGYGERDIGRTRAAWYPWRLHRIAQEGRADLANHVRQVGVEASHENMTPFGFGLNLIWLLIVVLNFPLLCLIMDLFFSAGERITLPVIGEPYTIGAIGVAALVVVIETAAGILAVHGPSRRLRNFSICAITVLCLGEAAGAWIRAAFMAGEEMGALGWIGQGGPGAAAGIGLLVPAMEATCAGLAWDLATQRLIKRLWWLAAKIWYYLCWLWHINLSLSWQIFHDRTKFDAPGDPPWPTIEDSIVELERAVRDLGRQALDLQQRLPDYCKQSIGVGGDCARLCAKILAARTDMERARASGDREIEQLSREAAACKEEEASLARQTPYPNLWRRITLVPFPGHPLRKQGKLCRQSLRRLEQRKRELRAQATSQRVAGSGALELNPERELEALQANLQGVHDSVFKTWFDLVIPLDNARANLALYISLPHEPVEDGDVIRHGACKEHLDEFSHTITGVLVPSLDRIWVALITAGANDTEVPPYDYWNRLEGWEVSDGANGEGGALPRLRPQVTDAAQALAKAQREVLRLGSEVDFVGEQEQFRAWRQRARERLADLGRQLDGK